MSEVSSAITTLVGDDEFKKRAQAFAELQIAKDAALKDLRLVSKRMKEHEEFLLPRLVDHGVDEVKLASGQKIYVSKRTVGAGPSLKKDVVESNLTSKLGEARAKQIIEELAAEQPREEKHSLRLRKSSKK